MIVIDPRASVVTNAGKTSLNLYKQLSFIPRT
jgi:hypothetical protein